MTCYKVVFKDGTFEYIPAYYGVMNDERSEATFLCEHNQVMVFGNVDKLYEIVRATKVTEVES